MLAITLASPLHCGQVDTSMLNIRFSRCTQVIVWWRYCGFLFILLIGTALTTLAQHHANTMLAAGGKYAMEPGQVHSRFRQQGEAFIFLPGGDGLRVHVMPWLRVEGRWQRGNIPSNHIPVAFPQVPSQKSVLVLCCQIDSSDIISTEGGNRLNRLTPSPPIQIRTARGRRSASSSRSSLIVFRV